jgi:hypothetical protein
MQPRWRNKMDAAWRWKRAMIGVAIGFAAACGGKTTEEGSVKPAPTGVTPPGDASPPIDPPPPISLAIEPCRLAEPAPAAEACGPGASCRVQGDELVESSLYLADPGLALREDGEPMIAYGWAAMPTAPGRLATRSGGTWTNQPLSDARVVSMSRSVGGGVTLVRYDGAYGLRFSTLRDGVTKPITQLVGTVHRNLVQDACGTTHTLVFDDEKSNDMAYLSLGASTQHVRLTASDGGDLTVAPNGDVLIMRIAWTAGSAALESLRNGVAMGPRGPYVDIGNPPVVLASTMEGATSIPHVVLRPHMDGGWIHASVSEAGGWRKEDVLANAGKNCLGASPSTPYERCDQDVTSYEVVDAAAYGSGTPRWLVLAKNDRGTYVSRCSTGGGGPDAGSGCSWGLEGAFVSTQTLEIAWLDAGKLQHAPIAGARWTDDLGKVAVGRGAMRIDATGRIHLAIYQRAPSGEVAIRYLRIGT